jgi:uncharacterized membrane protein
MYLTAFLGGLAVFFATHFYSAFRSRGEDSLAHRMGRGPYMGLYSLLSLASFAAMVWGYAYLKPWRDVWTPPDWTRWISIVIMIPAMVLIVAAYTPTGYIKKAVRHPMITAVGLWALAHVISNGDLASVILFGAFLIYAVVDRVAVTERGDVGAANVQHPNIFGDLLAVGLGLSLYAILAFYAHYIIFSVPVMLPSAG